VGFDVKKTDDKINATYHIYFDEVENPIECFSKVYDDLKNPSRDFAAIMTCSDAEENCPFIPGVELRIGTTYNDPKEFDNTPMQDTKYDERCKQIALETLYVFSKI
jgi:protein-tyrosine phosphatase/arsenate reductase